MALSIFEDKSKVPTSEDLNRTLAGSLKAWHSIRAYVKSAHPDASEEWKHSGKNYGWGYRLSDKKRVIVYLTPSAGCFLFSMVFGQKATTEALRNKLSKEIRTAIETAPVYAEGRGFRIEIRNEESLEDLKKLISVKLAH
jgi:hypothetical protein